jgi:drug/metabolite transporter (DMT)-like permease
MCGGSLSFAAMSMFVHLAQSYCDWQVTALARSGVALVVTAISAMASGVTFIIWRPVTIWLRSIAGSLSIVCTFFALARLPVSDVLTLTNMFPIWIAILSWPVLGERPTAGVWVAIFTSSVGVVLIEQPHLAHQNSALVCALAASLCTALAMMGLNRLGGVDPRAVVVHFSAVSILFGLGAFFIFERTASTGQLWRGQAVGVLLAIGVAATIGQLLLTKAFGAGSAAPVSVIGLTQIVFAVVFEIAFFSRKYDRPTLIGMAFIVLPTAWIMSHRPKRAVREPAITIRSVGEEAATI